jgi:hypothetical protein
VEEKGEGRAASGRRLAGSTTGGRLTVGVGGRPHPLRPKALHSHSIPGSPPSFRNSICELNILLQKTIIYEQKKCNALVLHPSLNI